MSLIGSIPIPVESTALYMAAVHPSPCIIRKRAFMADMVLSKFMLLFVHSPPAVVQSSLVMILSSGSASAGRTQLKNVPLKKLTPIIEKMRSSNVPTMRTFYIAPNVAKRALTIILRFSNLLITLRGLSALSALRALSAAN